MKKVAVIAGAGPAGLTAAYELLKRTDIIPMVFEATDATGGIAQTRNYKGNRMDIGGHRFFSKNARVTQWWFNILAPQGAPAADTEEKDHDIEYVAESVMRFLCPECFPKNTSSDHGEIIIRRNVDPEKEDEVMLMRPRLSRIFFRGRFFAYPLGITLTVAWRLGLWNTFLIGLSYLRAQIFPCKDERYLDAFFINRFGRRLYEAFFKDYTEKVWGVPCSTIRADWGAQRIKGLSLKRAVSHAIKDLFSSDFKKAQQKRETSLVTRFYYPKFGPGQMWETVADHVQKCGGKITLQHRVSGVHLHEGRVTSVTVENVCTGEEEEVMCDYFFSTMPIKHLIGMITPHPPVRVVEVAEGLRYRDFLTVGLLLTKLSISEKEGKVLDNWIYIQEGTVRVGRVQIYDNWSPYLLADRNSTDWIGLEYFVDEGGDLWVLPDKEMIKLGISEMERMGFLHEEDVLDACVVRMPKAYPAYFGSYDQLGVVQEYVDQIHNLFLIGRNGMHRYNNQDHSMLTAMMAVDNIIEGRTDSSNLWNVNLEGDYHEDE